MLSNPYALLPDEEGENRDSLYLSSSFTGFLLASTNFHCRN